MLYIYKECKIRLVEGGKYFSAPPSDLHGNEMRVNTDTSHTHTLVVGAGIIYFFQTRIKHS